MSIEQHQVSSVDIKLSCLNQRMFSCQTYMEQEGLKQQQISATAPRHHKHYILPSYVGQKVQNGQIYDQQSHIQAKPRPHPPGTPASKTLSWHLASENNSSLNGEPFGTADSKAFKMTTNGFNFLEAERPVAPMTLSRQLPSTSVSITANSFGFRDLSEVAKPLSAFRSFETPGRSETSQPPARSKSVLSVFFPKHKSLKQKTTFVS
ncbi:hypothetical protein HPP92_022869 [Vanilla planifolia]|uniref:Uncharacterized protein n=1 Tax=Vanilla planifolia TaxID=51239 RepID=A0A835PSY0_VANPL|nr:hypothetical protein HPP92_022869 [Vanilla planifolia]